MPNHRSPRAGGPAWAGPPRDDLWIHRPDVWSGAILGVALAGRSFRPSLMPRTSAHQAVVSGASGALGFAIGNAVYGATAQTGSLPLDLAVLGAAGAGGFVISRVLPEPEDDNAPEAHWRPIARAAGGAVAAGAAASTLGVVVRATTPRYRIAVGGAITALSAASGIRAVIAGVRAQHDAHEDYDPPPPRALPAVSESLGIAAGLTTVVTAFRHSSGVVRRALEKRLGVPPPASTWLGRGISVTVWGVLGKALVDQFVGQLRLYDRVVDNGFDRAPETSLASGGVGSPVSFARLGREGRRFVLNVPTAQDIAEVMGRPAMEPIRVCVGYAAAHTDEERVALAIDELRRTGAFDRALLVVGSAAGNGYVNTVALEIADYLSLGNNASVTVAYGRLPSYLALHRTSRGGRMHGMLLEAIERELAERPASARPKVVVYGESLGAWAGQDTFMHQGLGRFDSLGVAKALWVGTPAYSAWRREVIVEQRIPVPAGTVVEVERAEELLTLSGEEQERLRAVVVGNANDPVRYLHASAIVRRPPWLGRDRDDRPWGVPRDMQFLPGITAIQLIVDGINATRKVPGVFRATGHEYSAALPVAVAVAYGLPRPDAETWQRLVDRLQDVDAARAHHPLSPPSPEALAAVGAEPTPIPSDPSDPAETAPR